MRDISFVSALPGINAEQIGFEEKKKIKVKWIIEKFMIFLHARCEQYCILQCLVIAISYIYVYQGMLH